MKHNVWIFAIAKENFSERLTALVIAFDRLRINPLDPEGYPLKYWASIIADIFSEVFSLKDASKILIIHCINLCYERFGTYANPASVPTLLDLIDAIKEIRVKALKTSSRDMLGYADRWLSKLSIFENLYREIVECSKGFSIKEMMNHKIIFDMVGVSPVIQILMMNILLAKKFYYKMARKIREPLSVNVIDEASRLFGRRAYDPYDEPILFHLLRRGAEYWETFILADQSLTMMDLAIRQNVGTKILFRQSSEDDLLAIARMISITPEIKETLEGMETGKALVHMPDKHKKVFPVDLPMARQWKIDNGPYTEQVLESDGFKTKERRQAQRRQPEQREPQKKTTRGAARYRPILTSIAKNWQFNLKDHREHLGINPQTFQKNIEELMEHGYIEDYYTNDGTKGAKSRRFMITEDGAKNIGIDIKDCTLKGKGNDEHRYFQNLIAMRLEAQGLSPIIECRDADIGFSMDGRTYALEIEMDEDAAKHAIDNTERNLRGNFDYSITLTRGEREMKYIKRKLEQLAPDLLDRVEFRFIREFTNKSFDIKEIANWFNRNQTTDNR